ncbi:MAG: phosphoenolpyruvate carboxylase, partial [Haloarculaceae archaeon]
MSLHNRGVRQDVRELGALLGDVLKEQTSTDAFETVESLRTAAIDYRDGELDSRDDLRETIDQLSPEEEGSVARAFATYFELINLAEERERVRAVRKGSQEGTLDDSLDKTVKALSEDGADTETVEEILDDVLIEPTFTAHPTEARRGTVKAKLRSIADHLQTLDERNLTDREKEGVWEKIEAEVTSLWQTRQVRQRQPEPGDEVRNIQWYLENTLFDVVGEVYSEFEDIVTREYPDIDLPKLFEFRSWAGSDRDGNPYVTVDVTDETLQSQREIVVERYRTQLKRLSAILSQDGDRYPTTAAFQASLEADIEQFPSVAEEAEERYPDEPYRQKFRLMRERLNRVGDIRPGGYEDDDELLE